MPNTKHNPNTVLAAERINKSFGVVPVLFSVSFDLIAGEILGFAGLVGSGRTEAFEVICGLKSATSGTLIFENNEVNFTTVAQSRDAGIAYLTKDRKDKGLRLEQTMQPNMTLFALPKFVKNFALDTQAEEEALQRGIRRFDVRTLDKNIKTNDLSGGNQQKLLLAKVMEIEPKILIVDEPTRGIDVGGTRGMKEAIKAIIDGSTLQPIDVLYPAAMIATAMDVTVVAFKSNGPVASRYILGATLIDKTNAKSFYFPDSPF